MKQRIVFQLTIIVFNPIVPRGRLPAYRRLRAASPPVEWGGHVHPTLLEGVPEIDADPLSLDAHCGARVGKA